MKYSQRKPLTELIGQVFTRLTAIEEVPTPPCRQRRLRCQCACGRTVTVNVQNLKRGITRSCGCLVRDVNSILHRTHGGRRTPEYQAWCNAKQRCDNPHDQDFPDYGARGIRFASEWRDDFGAFLAHIGTRPQGTSLERIDPNGNYKPGNVRWADKFEQANNKRTSHRLTYNGQTHTLAEWSRKCGISDRALWLRIRRGWPVQDALTIPAVKGANQSLRR